LFCVMNRSTGMRLAILLGIGVLTAQNSKAGSAVAWDGHGHVAYSYGRSMEVEEQRVLDLGLPRYGPSLRILAASDVSGYGAIATARIGTRWVYGVVLGRRTKAEAEQMAIERCLKAGGVNPRVKSEFRG
jgi:hypothetical protein